MRDPYLVENTPSHSTDADALERGRDTPTWANNKGLPLDWVKFVDSLFNGENVNERDLDLFPTDKVVDAVETCQKAAKGYTDAEKSYLSFLNAASVGIGILSGTAGLVSAGLITAEAAGTIGAAGTAWGLVNLVPGFSDTLFEQIVPRDQTIMHDTCVAAAQKAMGLHNSTYIYDLREVLSRNLKEGKVNFRNGRAVSIDNMRREDFLHLHEDLNLRKIRFEGFSHSLRTPQTLSGRTAQMHADYTQYWMRRTNNLVNYGRKRAGPIKVRAFSVTTPDVIQAQVAARHQQNVPFFHNAFLSALKQAFPR